MLAPTAFGFCDINFSWGDHICAIFENHDQQMSVMLPFITHGLRAEQLCVWISPPPAADAFRRALSQAGGDLPTLEASGQLVLISDLDFYLRDGLFLPDRTLDLILTLMEDGQRRGYSSMRVTCDHSWLAGGPVNVDLWEKYEHQVTECLAKVPVVGICQYDQRRCPGDFMLAALHTHPMVILGETISRNPFFTSPAANVAGRPDVM